MINVINRLWHGWRGPESDIGPTPWYWPEGFSPEGLYLGKVQYHYPALVSRVIICLLHLSNTNCGFCLVENDVHTSLNVSNTGSRFFYADKPGPFDKKRSTLLQCKLVIDSSSRWAMHSDFFITWSNTQSQNFGYAIWQTVKANCIGTKQRCLFLIRFTVPRTGLCHGFER